MSTHSQPHWVLPGGHRLTAVPSSQAVPGAQPLEEVQPPPPPTPVVPSAPPWHLPATQTWPGGQRLPQAPQFPGSSATETQAPAHSRVPGGQPHLDVIL